MMSTPTVVVPALALRGSSEPTMLYPYVTPLLGSVNSPCQCGTVLSVASGVAPPIVVNFGDMPASPKNGSALAVLATALLPDSAVMRSDTHARTNAWNGLL